MTIFISLLINLILALTGLQVSVPTPEVKSTPAPVVKAPSPVVKKAPVKVKAPAKKAPTKKAPVPVKDENPEVLTGNQCEYEDGSGDKLPCYWDAMNNGNNEGDSYWILSDETTFYDEEGIYDGYVTPDEKVICPEGWTRSWDNGDDGYRWSACM